MDTVTKGRIDAYKVGFLCKMAAEGLSPFGALKGILSAGVGAAKEPIRGGYALAKDLAVTIPSAIGRGIGGMHAEAVAPTEDKITSLKQMEELELLKRLTREVRERANIVKTEGSTRE